ncbi:2OG-Fe(II) oxygenase [Achromobacter marplatensis]|uniref:2OG-Fe(II) oxygenase n=1 Tax=Achromobacter marplatensis TaxID=470868 RepID=UPI0039F6DB39
MDALPALSLPDLDWVRIAESLDAHGNAIAPGLLTPAQCASLAAGYSATEGYRSRIVMARHGFGRGEYKYFSYPLPPLLQHLRTALYPRLAPIANRWNQQLGVAVQYPPDHAAFLQRCHDAGQRRPTPLILEYGPGDYNCLHQDLYGEHVFPLQVAVLLSRPGVDFTGGEFVMTETGSREQRADVLPLQQGDALIFTVNQRPVPGARGWRRTAMRHGVSALRSGQRHTLGLIFHDAQ